MNPCVRMVLGAIVVSGALVAAQGCEDEGGNGSGGGGGGIGCGETPAATECTALCEDACGDLAGCGFDDAGACTASCFETFACPGETPGQDAAICDGQAGSIAGSGCSELCTWAETWGGYGTGVLCAGGAGGAAGAGGGGGAGGTGGAGGG